MQKKHWVPILGVLALAGPHWLGTAEVDSSVRFKSREGFIVQEVYPPSRSGSVVAMSFDSRGRLVISREKGPVFILLDEDRDGRVDREIQFTDQVQNCQGLQFDGNDLYAVGKGPDGPGLYKVLDVDGDSNGDRVETVTRFTQEMAEHGPHAVFFGPEGHLYVMLGNHTGLVDTPGYFSPHRDFIEGNLLPAYVDARGHAARIRAPGGIVVRMDPKSGNGEWDMVMGGFRNAYDAAFNLMGELFTFDSDMEWDINLPWFRPVRTLHLVPGGEYGWRTGSGKWPDYYPDSLPSLTDLGRGSPVGVTVYQHYAFPSEFYDSFIYGDWSRGRILSGFLEPSGATYRERSEEFVLGQPLNVTDLEVGPDGALYFSKGGRFTEGGIYRVVYNGGLKAAEFGTGSVEDALKQPQPRSAWGRARIAEIKRRTGNSWAAGLQAVLQDRNERPERRVRALELLQVYGPEPDEILLTRLGEDPQWEIRAASTLYLGLSATDSVRRELVKRFPDPHPAVRRRACESLIRTRIFPGMALPFSPPRDVFPLLDDPDRFVRYAARQVLRRLDRNLWRDQALRLNRFPAASEALLALVQTVRGTNDVPVLLERELELLKADPRGTPLRDLLRVVALTMLHDQNVNYSAIYKPLAEILMTWFPSGDTALDHELAIILSYLETPGITGKLAAELNKPGTSRQQQIHYVYCLRTIQSGWTPEDRDVLIAWFEKVQIQYWKGGASFLGYLQNLWNDFVTTLPDEERKAAIGRIPSFIPLVEDPSQGGQLSFRRQNYNETLTETELEEYLLFDPMSYEGKTENGRRAFEKAFCSNCHIHGDVGREAGPDLTDVSRRFPRKDLVEAVLYPSRTVSDLWKAVELVTTDGTAVVGVILQEDVNSVTLVTAAGFQMELPKSEIQSRRVADQSLMPEGLVHNLTLREIVDLFAFLEQGETTEP